MNRKHKIKKYLQTFYELKKINSEIKFSSDFIVAYPGENKKDFQETLNLIKEIKFINSFSFIFSSRPGTVSSKLKTLDKITALRRLEVIQQTLFENQIEMNKSLENKIINVLVENKTEDKKKYFGRSEYMTSVIFDGIHDLVGKVVKVKVLKSNQNTLFGTAINTNHQRVA